MAFDQTTRNRLQSFVSKARAILSEEFTRQLQATYGLDPNQGTIADIESLSHLDNYQLQTAHILRDTLQHYMTTTAGKTQKEQVKLVLERIVREQAFTVLNRLAALRMAEARGFLLESIGSGYSSQGFQLYQMLEDGSHGETGDAYQSYLFSLFDEFGLDLAVLFDRFSVQGRLFPRETALLQLLEQINDYEIEPLWAEDETIGWIYQYFNSQEERKKMRSESSAPRNSRELAVRNQFFTPRYVVEFLTDNTLGRIWYEMTKGNTALVDSCQYLVKRPNEVFLSQGDNNTTQSDSKSKSETAALTQEEVLNQPVYIAHRPLKDPRTIRMLDPACGSMHFGLYAFDLFEQIYLEAWNLEDELGTDAFEREMELQSLQSTYGDLDSFKQQIPKLIIEYNIHGVDIDPRAVQIAGLSLWQRAQRAWYEQGVKPNQRPTIVKSNIVCAEPMPGEQDLLKEFTSTLNPPALGQLVEVIFEKMALAGEAGTLLKIEQEIESAISKARQQWDKTKDINGVRDLFEEELVAATPQQQLGFDLSGIDDETFWEDAEQLILQALKSYSEQATSAAGDKRLFAEDAAKGFAFIDLSRKRFDVVLMNPPFGETSSKIKNYIKSSYSHQVQDLYCLFVDRGVELSINGNLGAITSSSFLKYNEYSKFREYLINNNNELDYLIDLGWDVLDNAYVSVALYVLSSFNLSPWVFVDSRESLDKGSDLLNYCENITNQVVNDKVFIKNPSLFESIDGAPFCYSFSEDFFDWIKKSKKLIHYTENNGIGAGPHNFFFRLSWEVPKVSSINHSWHMLPNGGQFSPYYRSINLLIDWRSNGEFVKEHLRKKYPYLKGNVGIKIQREDMYFREGITFGKKTDRFNAQLMPKGCIPSFEGIAIYPKKVKDTHWILSYLNSRFVAYYLNLTSGLHKNSVYLDRLPIPNFSDEDKESLNELCKYSFREAQEFHAIFETDNNYKATSALRWLKDRDSIDSIFEWFKNIELNLARTSESIELIVNRNIPLTEEVLSEVKFDQGGTYFDPTNEIKRKALAIPKTLSFYTLRKFSSNEDDISFERIQSVEDEVNWVTNYIISLSLNNVFHENSSAVLDVSSSTESVDVSVSQFFEENFKNSNFYHTVDLSDKASAASHLGNMSKFFSYHYKEYSASRRTAPIYWPLQTASGSYTLWVYYHRLNSQTLYSCVNDFVEPKLALVTEDLNALSNRSNRSSTEEKELTKLTDLQNELKDFRDELLRLAKIWKPNLNDGVQITAAPLWKLFQHTAWQKKLKETWEKLEEGEYDWAHLAASMWPDRVLRKCHQDRSLAIAHDVEDLFWQGIEVPVMRGKKPTGKTKLEWQPIPASETMLNDMVNEAKARLQ